MRSLLLAALVVGLACARPVPDRPRHEQRTFRMATDGAGRVCYSELPMTVEFGEDFPALDVFTGDAPWAEVLGVAVTTLARRGELADVEVAYEKRPEDHPTWLASCWSRCDGLRLRHRIAFYGKYETALNVRVATHELGHALGVEQDGDGQGHSGDIASIMYHQVGDDTAQTVTDADATALRRAWRPNP